MTRTPSRKGRGASRRPPQKPSSRAGRAGYQDPTITTSARPIDAPLIPAADHAAALNLIEMLLRSPLAIRVARLTDKDRIGTIDSLLKSWGG